MHGTALEHGDERIALPVDVVSEHAGGGHGEGGALGCRVGIIEGDRRRVGAGDRDREGGAGAAGTVRWTR